MTGAMGSERRECVQDSGVAFKPSGHSGKRRGFRTRFMPRKSGTIAVYIVRRAGGTYPWRQTAHH